MRNKLIIVAGYARSGKSTLSKQLKLNKIPFSSSSDILAIETLKAFGLPVNDYTLQVLEKKKRTNSGAGSTTE
jgi:tRNA uridine 5-carbamoylmethylation protein Kti12